MNNFMVDVTRENKHIMMSHIVGICFSVVAIIATLLCLA